MEIVTLAKPALCRYGDKVLTRTGVIKTGTRPTPECPTHVQRSIERNEQGR